uniref:Viral polypeptide VP4 n=1 Tax=Motacilla cinerea parvoviridae sp. TaxID=2794518 RepID=A0A8A4XDC3_9VIRU|nr:MAG: viral polypeptide VP4 [Motacilla cinerea parvoviridae sp.]
MSGANNPVSGLEDGERDESVRKRRAVEMDEENPENNEGEQQDGDTPLNTTAKWNTGTYTYSHHRILSTLGYQFVNIQASSLDISGSVTSFLTTPLARVPCHGIPFYMSRSEFNELPPGSQIKKCIVELQPLGYRIPFTTNSASISAVNAATVVLGASAHGLTNKYGGNNYVYTSTTDSPMVPTQVSLDALEGCNELDYWGPQVNATSTTLPYTSIPGCFGREIQLRDYYTSDYLQSDLGETPPTIMDGVKLFKMTPYNASASTISWEYRPQVCVLKPVATRQGRYIYKTTANTTNATKSLIGWKNRAPYSVGFNYAKATNSTNWDPTTIAEMNHNEQPASTTYDFYTNIIEQSGITSRGYSEYGGSYLPPSLHIGCLPCNSFVTDVKDSQVANIVCLWSCRTRVEIEYSTQYTSAWNGIQPWNAQVLSNWHYLQLGYAQLNIRGMRGYVHTLTTQYTENQDPTKVTVPGSTA